MIAGLSMNMEGSFFHSNLIIRMAVTRKNNSYLYEQNNSQRISQLGTLKVSKKEGTDHMADFDAAKDKVSGKVKETAGKVTGDESTEAKGKTEQMVGEAKEKLSDAKDKIAEKFNDVVDKAKGKKED